MPSGVIISKRTSDTAMAILAVTMFVTGFTGFVFECILSTVATYVLGNSVEQFSITIGLMLACMGIGSFAQQYVQVGRVARRLGQRDLERGVGRRGGVVSMARLVLPAIVSHLDLREVDSVRDRLADAVAAVPHGRLVESLRERLADEITLAPLAREQRTPATASALSQSGPASTRGRASRAHASRALDPPNASPPPARLLRPSVSSVR